MSKTVTHKPKFNNRSRTGGLILIGSGLLLLGLVTGFLFFNPSESSGSSEKIDGRSRNQNSSVPAEVNFQPPNLELSDLQGNEVSLEDFKGKVILINNWATWCPPCKAEMPALEAFHRTHKDNGFVLIAIDAGDPPAEVAEFIEDYQLTFHVWLDPQNLALQAFKNNGLPNSYVIDKDFIVRLAWTGAISETALEEFVTPIIQE